jgi:hypothetical protein
MKIQVQIDRLVLDGLPVTRAQGTRVRAAVERELSRLLQGGGVTTPLALGGATPTLTAPIIRFSRRERPETLGKRIAQSIHGGIGGMGRPG